MKHRSRIIKGEFFQNRKLSGLSPRHRLLFIGLWTIADREGRLLDDLDLIKAMVFPFENIDIDKLLTDLAGFGFIERYNGLKGACIFIPKFLDHQKIHSHEAQSKLPKPQNVVKCSVMPSADSEISIGSSKSNSRSNSKKEEIPYSEIIEHLNVVSGKKFKVTTELYREKIRARWREKYTLEDFHYVNLVKAADWLGTKHEKHLNPETLYGRKFDKYRNERPKTAFSDMSDHRQQNVRAGMDWLKKKGFKIDNEGIRSTSVCSTATGSKSDLPQRPDG